MLLYLAGIGSRVGKQYILFRGKVSLCWPSGCLPAPRRLGEGSRGRPRRFLGGEKRAEPATREARCHPCHSARSPPPRTHGPRRLARGSSAPRGAVGGTDPAERTPRALLPCGTKAHLLEGGWFLGSSAHSSWGLWAAAFGLSWEDSALLQNHPLPIPPVQPHPPALPRARAGWEWRGFRSALLKLVLTGKENPRGD